MLAVQLLGTKEIGDGIWLVSLMRYDLGYIDLEQRTLQTIDKPHRARDCHPSVQTACPLHLSYRTINC